MAAAGKIGDVNPPPASAGRFKHIMLHKEYKGRGKTPVAGVSSDAVALLLVATGDLASPNMLFFSPV